MYKKINNLRYRWLMRNTPQIKYDYEELLKEGFYSQYGQDKFVNELLENKREGYFVDIGANDGITFSNSYFFEKSLDWKGLAVEPQTIIFDKLIKTRNCHFYNGCISSTEGFVEFMTIENGADMLSGIVDKYDQKHKERIDNEIKKSGGKKVITKVNAKSLNSICNENQIKYIDFLSIDTEGGELEILKSIDFNKISIDIISVENNYSDINFYKFLKSKGFKLIAKVVTDEIYKKC